VHQDEKEMKMDYVVAITLYLASILGVFYSIYCIMRFKEDKAMVGFMTLSAFSFTGLTYLTGTIVQAIS
jgi:hypothetical protein